MSDGTVTVGGVVSWTVTVNDLSFASAALQVTVVVLMRNVSPLT
jgi:hypothetical protein